MRRRTPLRRGQAPPAAEEELAVADLIDHRSVRNAVLLARIDRNRHVVLVHGHVRQPPISIFKPQSAVRVLALEPRQLLVVDELAVLVDPVHRPAHRSEAVSIAVRVLGPHVRLHKLGLIGFRIALVERIRPIEQVVPGALLLLQLRLPPLLVQQAQRRNVPVAARSGRRRHHRCFSWRSAPEAYPKAARSATLSARARRRSGAIAAIAFA